MMHGAYSIKFKKSFAVFTASFCIYPNAVSDTVQMKSDTEVCVCVFQRHTWMYRFKRLTLC